MAGTLLTLTLPLSFTVSTLGILKNGSDRALALPAATMLWQVMIAQQASLDSGYALTAAHVAVIVLLWACWQQKRNVARWATIACCAAVFYVRLSPTLLANG